MSSAALKIRLPKLHDHQEVFTNWTDDHPEAQVLVAPCGTKLGKSFGAATWLLLQALVNSGSYCVWIAPTYLKARIGFRYIKAMLPDVPFIDSKDGAMEIYLGNGSFIKFLHGRDAEVTVEGEAIDFFVIDEAGKTARQLWYSLLTTITQTMGMGIVTGTPNGFSWYYDIYRKAKAGDPFFCWANLPTRMSPFVNPRAIEQARRLLPKNLFDQYYEAIFTSESNVYGDLSKIWDETLKVERKNFWIHPDQEKKKLPMVLGVDLAKRRDYTVIAGVAGTGETMCYARFRHKQYAEQMAFLAKIAKHFPSDENEVRFDRTGVGDAVSEMLVTAFDNANLDWTITPVVFTNASKMELVSRTTMSIETGWWRCPRIERVEHEFASLEVSVTKTGLSSYSAPEGDHDDVHWAFNLAISGAYASTVMSTQDELIEAAMSGKLLTDESADTVKDPLAEYADLAAADDIDDEMGSVDDDESDDDNLDIEDL